MHILFVTATRIGDAVLSTGLLAYLLERYPWTRLSIAAGPLAAPLFEAMPGLERVLVIEKRRWSMHWPPLYVRVAAKRWDLVVDLRGSALAWLLRAQKRKVMAKGDPSEHRVRQLARLFDLDPPPNPCLWTAPRHERSASRLVPSGVPILAIGPAANWRGKQWRAERFAGLASRLTAAAGPLAGFHVAVLGVQHERAQAEPLLAAISEDRRIDLIGRTELLTTAAVLRRCAMFIGNDTGLMHIAAAVGTPTLGLFGPSPVAQYAPWGLHAAFVQSTDPPEAMFRPGFDHRTTDTLMDGLSVDAVEAAAIGLWRSAASAVA